MLDMTLFRQGTFSGAILINLLSVVGLVGFLYFVAQHLQLVVGLSPMQDGLALVPGLAALISPGLLVVPIPPRYPPPHVVPVQLDFSVAAFVVVDFAPQWLHSMDSLLSR